MYDINGWPVDLDRLPSWERNNEKLYRDNAIFEFFKCPCAFGMRGLKRPPHRIADCKWMAVKVRTPVDADEALAKRMAAATTPIKGIYL